jgi:hypothetical protein
VDEVEAALGASDANVGQAAFLSHFLIVLALNAASVGEQALFHTHHKDNGKLQSFGCVQSQQCQGIFFVVEIILFADEADFLQEEAERVLARLQVLQAGTILDGNGA